MFWKYLGIELHLPDFRRRCLERSDSSVSVNVEDPDKAVKRSRGGDDAGRVGGDRDNTEAVTSIGSLQVEVVRTPELDGLVERASEEEWRPGVGGWDPRNCPY